MIQVAEVKPAEEGVLLVGSLPLSDTETVFRRCDADLSKHLRRVPDGETGKRHYFVGFQREIFEHCPHVTLGWAELHFDYPKTDQVVDEKLEVVLKEQPLDSEYDHHAIESYQIFRRLRDEEKLFAPTTRFQVSLPTPFNTVCCWIKPQHRAQIEPHYEKALHDACTRIQSSIPKSSLTIQLDVAADMALVEGIIQPHWDTTKQSAFDGVISSAVRMASKVDPEVELGFHLCYGDINHKHFVEPEDTGNLTRVAIALLNKVPRHIDYIHLPVPITRTDQAYFEPLAALEKTIAEAGGHTRLYLGLVHANDEAGTKERIQTARTVLNGPFGIATECGLGRTPPVEIESIISISKSMSDPIVKLEGSF